MARYAQHYQKRGSTPQTQPIAGREKDMVENSAGGFTFMLDKWGQFERFLILGTAGGTYYANEKDLTVENAKVLEECIAEDGLRAVDLIVQVSHEGRAPKNDPALFALALAASATNDETRKYALNALPQVARVGTHLFHFVDYVQKQRGWGRALKHAVANWYTQRSVDSLANQLVKYQQRDGFSHRDILRIVHPRVEDSARHAAIVWATTPTLMPGTTVVNTTRFKPSLKAPDGSIIPALKLGADEMHELPPLLLAYEALRKEPTAENAVALIRDAGLPREAIPTELLNDEKVWKALLVDMPMTALIRNLGKMTSIDVLKPMAPEVKFVTTRVTDKDGLHTSRIHPFQVLLALKTYAAGAGFRGKLTWKQIPQIVDALDDAFYLAFKNVEPTGKRIMIGLDVSASMNAPIMDSPLEVCEAAAAMAMTVARTEENYHVFAFDHGMKEVDITAKSKLHHVLKQTRSINGGGTDCSLPMQYALKKKIACDAFWILTDNETWAGSMHPVEALREYRAKMGIPAKLVVCGMTSTGFSIADPKDAGMLDICGMSTAVPAVVAGFIRA